MKAKIYQPTRTATQSGKKNSGWLLELVTEENPASIDNIMGWTSSDNTLTQLKLHFQNQEDAVAYAKNQDWNYQIIQPVAAKIVKKSYSDNFA
jgi:hypothetical protein